MSRSTLVPLAGFVVLCLAASPGGADDDSQKVARETVDKALKAVGGADATAKMKSVTFKIKSKVKVDNLEVETSEAWSIKDVDRYRVETAAKVGDNNVDFILVLNGPKGWGKLNADPATELPKEALAAARNTFRAARLVHVLHLLKDKTFELSPLGEMKVEGQDAVGIRVVQKNHPEVSLFFDKKTGLPLKSEVRVADADGGQEILIEIVYAGFKDFDGVKHFSKFTVKRDGKTSVESEIEAVKPQDLDDSAFDKP